MPPYLTPSKIGLLALIETYTDGIVLTGATVPILSFILNRLLPETIASQETDSASLQTLPFVPGLASFETLLDAHPGPHPGRTLWDYFLEKLWAIDSFHQLHLFFATRSSLVAKTRHELRKDAAEGMPPPAEKIIVLSRTSPCGNFVRKAKVEFDRLKFTEAIALWTSFVRWREASKAYMLRRNGDMKRWAGDKSLHDGELQWGSAATEVLGQVLYGMENEGENVSTSDVEELLEFQIEQLQKTGTRVPDDVKDKVKALLHESFIVPSLAHYLKFVDAWRAGDYTTSFDNLHRYFDYTMQNRDRTLYQYALMSLAILQADFGCFEEAVAAMLETVSTARENKDMPCLNFALNWLYHFAKLHPGLVQRTEYTSMLGGERDGLTFLRIKAKESGMYTLWSSALLSEARMGMSNGESVATAFENILKCSQLILDKNMKSMVGPQISIHLALWSRLGISHLAHRYCDIFLSCHARYAPFDDTLRFTCRIAYLLTERGLYDVAMEKLDALDEHALRSWKSNQYWRLYRGILRLKRELHHNNLDGASQLLSQLLQHDTTDAEPDLIFEINHLHIDYLIRRTDYRGALVKLERVASYLEEDGIDINMRIKILIVKALLQDKSGRPQKGFSVAVRAASIAWRARLLPTLWAAMGAIANILTSLAEYQASAQILLSIIPRALEHESCFLNAQLYSFLVNAYMGLAGQADAGSFKRKENLTRSLDFIDRAFDEYSAVEDIEGQCEMMAKKATIMKLLGEGLLANDYASKYLDLRREAKEKWT